MRVALFFSLFLPLSALADLPVMECATPSNSEITVLKQVADQSMASTAGTKNCAAFYMSDAEKEWRRVVPTESEAAHLVRGKRLIGLKSEAQLLEKMLGTTPPRIFSNLPKTCNTIHCALTAIFGSRESALRALTIGHRDGYVISVDQEWREKHAKDYIWKEDDLRQTELGMRMMPDQMRKMKSLQTISRWPPGIKPAGDNENTELPAAYASGRRKLIRLFEGTFSPGPGWARATVIHEIAHHLDFTCQHDHNETFHERTGFASLSGWRTERIRKPGKDGELEDVDETKHHENANFPTDYASSEPWEDWAESVSFAITAPDYLKAIAPEKYEKVKEVLLGGKDPPGFGDPQILSMIPLSEELLRKCATRWAKSMRIDIGARVPDLAEACAGPFLPSTKDMPCQDRERRVLQDWTVDYIDRIPANKRIQASVEAGMNEARIELPRLKKNCEQAKTPDEACLRREVGLLLQSGHLSKMPSLADELARSLDIKPAVRLWRKP